MKRVMFIGFFILAFLMSSQAFSQKIYYDLGAVGISGTDDNVTGLHDQWGFYAKSQNIVNIGNDGFSVGDRFTNVGMLKVGSLIDFGFGAIGDTEGLNTNYEITTAWNNLTGVVTDVDPYPYTGGVQTLYFSYDPGITITIYIDDTPDFDATYDYGTHTFTNFGTATDGIPILDITLDGGTGHVYQTDTNSDGTPDYVITSSATLYGRVTHVYVDNFLFFDDAGDFYDLYMNRSIILSFVDQNADNFRYIFDEYPPNVITVADHNGSIDFAVPEPATIILVGSGLLGLGLFLRKRSD